MDRSDIERAATLAGLALAPDADIEVTGADPVLASPFHLGEGAATALALAGQEADGIARMRGHAPQRVSVDVRHAAASLHSFALLTLDGARPPLTPRAGIALTGVFECAGGRYIHLHGSFTDGPAVLAELGLPPDAASDAIAGAVRARDAFELEDALAAKGLCGAVCRTPDEWLAHPQGALLAARPAIEIAKIGAAPPEPFAPAERPLAGVRVLDVTRVLAGPTCARTLAEHGADVLHISSPRLPTVDVFEMDTGHGKRQAYLDLDDAGDVSAMRALIRGADVVSQGYRFGSLARRRFGPRDAAALRPGIIYVSENAYGHDGPWRGRPGWEQLAQAATGVTVIQGEPRPSITPAAMNDYTTGYFAAAGVMMALRRRATEGGSWLVTVSLAQTSMWYMRLGHDLDRAAASGIGDAPALMEEVATPYGRMARLRPPLRMSGTAPRWTLPSSPPGSGAAQWIERDGAA